MSGNKYLNVGPTVAGHTLTFDDSGALNVDGSPVAGGATVVSLTYWDGDEQSDPFGVPCYSTPPDYTPGEGVAILGATITIGSGGIPSGVLLDTNGDPIQDGWSFPASLYVQGTTILDIVAFSAYNITEAGGILWWQSNGGSPVPVPFPGGIETGGPVIVNNASIFAFDGNPNGSVTSRLAGDICIDQDTPALWQASAGSSDSDWVQAGGGGGGADMGYIALAAVNFSQDVVYARNAVAPFFNISQGEVVASESSYMMDWLPLNVANAGDAIQVELNSFLAADLWDSVDVAGTIVVWDLTATNLISCTFEENVVADTSTAAAPLTQTQLIGSDLSVVSNQIISAAGGIYNVLINTTAEWH